MCNINGIIFGATNIKENEVGGKDVLEIGSLNVNGSLRMIAESFKPNKYIGVDIENGPGVDTICKAENIENYFGKESFDYIISTELLEHVRDWRKAISNIKNVCRPNGLILITTRSRGFGYHGYPNDFWRYELEDMEEIFSDCEIVSLVKDDSMPGVFVKIRKPANFREKDLSMIKLYSVITRKRTRDIANRERASLLLYLSILKDLSIRLAFKIARKIYY